MNKPTIKDIAKFAGVSIATVSYVVNGKRNITEKTKQKVLSVIKKYGYKPNSLARDFKKQNTRNIGLLLDVFEGPIFRELISDINSESLDYNYNFIIAPYFKSSLITPEFFVEKSIDGAIVMSPSLNDNHILCAADFGVKFILLDRKLEHDNIFNLIINNEEGISKAVEYLISKDRKKLGFIQGTDFHHNSKKRFAGFKKSLEKHSLKLYEEFIFKGNFNIKSGVSAGSKIFAMKDRPDAIVCSNDETAVGLISELTRLGIKVPDQISVTGFDNIKYSEFSIPPLTTISHSQGKYGNLATKMLIKGLNGKKIKGTMLIPTQLIIRES